MALSRGPDNLILNLYLNYRMGSQRQWMVFELLDLLSVVIIKELELFKVRLDIFYALSEFSMHLCA